MRVQGQEKESLLARLFKFIPTALFPVLKGDDDGFALRVLLSPPPHPSRSPLRFSAKMGVLQEVAGPLSQQFSQLGLGAQIGVSVAAVLVLAVTLNVLQQVLFKNPNEPPVVFHWFPVIGSTITYGMDPPRFFHESRQKVRQHPRDTVRRPANNSSLAVRRLLHLCPPRKEDHLLCRHPGQRLHPERQDPRRERRRDLHRPHHPRVRQGCRLRLPQLEAYGAKEGV